MKTRFVIFIIPLCIGFNLFAEPPKLSFGPRIGIGRCRFTDTPEISEPGVALQASITASWQFRKFFALEFSPATSVYSAKLKKWVQDGVTNRGKPILYSYKDIYNIYSVEFPVMAKFSISHKKFSLHGFFGPGIALTMGGTHSKVFDDERYSGQGFHGHPMFGLRDSFYLYVTGAGIEFKAKRGIVGLDFRMQHTGPVAKSDESKFSAQSATIGMSWKLTDW